MKLISSALVFLLLLATGCSTTKVKAKLAESVGCNENEATLFEESQSPVHGYYILTCKEKTYKCLKTPVYRQCELQEPSPPSQK